LEGASAIDGLVGGIVTQAGPLIDATANPADQDVLARLNLRPIFVSIERISSMRRSRARPRACATG
jgi:hypothetical protein